MPALFFGGKKVELPVCVFLSNIKKWILEKWNVWRGETDEFSPLFLACNLLFALRAGLLPPFLIMYGLQPQQLLFLRVKFLLRNNAAVQQFFEFFQFISGGNSGCILTFCGGLFCFPFFRA